MSRKTDPAHEATDALIDRMEKDIAKEYAKANREVQGKLAAHMKQFEEKGKQWQKWVSEGTKTQQQYITWLKGQVFTGKRWADMRDSLATDYVNARKIAESVADGYKPEAYAINHNFATYEIEKAARVDTSYTLYSRESVERLFRDNPKLYQKPGAKIQQLIKDGKLKRWDRKQIQSVITQSILQGESIPNIAKRLEKVTGGDHAAAVRNARTMMTGAQNAGRMDAYHRANEIGIPTKKTWVATLDNRTRHWHRELDGVTVAEDEPFENEYGTIMYPGDPNADGANIYNCRCTMVATVDGDDIDFSDTSLRNDDHLGDMSYEEWLEGHG